MQLYISTNLFDKPSCMILLYERYRLFEAEFAISFVWCCLMLWLLENIRSIASIALLYLSLYQRFAVFPILLSTSRCAQG
jgi:hypothetical protein